MSRCFDGCASNLIFSPNPVVFTMWFCAAWWRLEKPIPRGGGRESAWEGWSPISDAPELTGLPGYACPQAFTYCCSENIDQETNPSSPFSGVEKDEQIKLRMCVVTSATEGRGCDSEHICGWTCFTHVSCFLRPAGLCFRCDPTCFVAFTFRMSFSAPTLFLWDFCQSLYFHWP